MENINFENKSSSMIQLLVETIPSTEAVMLEKANLLRRRETFELQKKRNEQDKMSLRVTKILKSRSSLGWMQEQIRKQLRGLRKLSYDHYYFYY